MYIVKLLSFMIERNTLLLEIFNIFFMAFTFQNLIKFLGSLFLFGIEFIVILPNPAGNELIACWIFKINVFIVFTTSTCLFSTLSNCLHNLCVHIEMFSLVHHTDSFVLCSFSDLLMVLIKNK